MKEAIKNPNFFLGDLYFVNNLNLTDKIDFEQALIDLEYDYNWKIDRGMIIPNIDNERLKFDIIPPNDYYGGFFSGFLYPDEKVLGKVEYVKEAKMADVRIDGRYKKLDENTVLLCAIWINPNGVKEYFWAELNRHQSDTSDDS